MGDWTTSRMLYLSAVWIVRKVQPDLVGFPISRFAPWITASPLLLPLKFFPQTTELLTVDRIIGNRDCSWYIYEKNTYHKASDWSKIIVHCVMYETDLKASMYIKLFKVLQSLLHSIFNSVLNATESQPIIKPCNYIDVRQSFNQHSQFKQMKRLCHDAITAFLSFNRCTLWNKT